MASRTGVEPFAGARSRASTFRVAAWAIWAAWFDDSPT